MDKARRRPDFYALLLEEAKTVSRQSVDRLRELRRRYPFPKEVVNQFLAEGIDFRRKRR